MKTISDDAAQGQTSGRSREWVVLVHGLGGNRLWMKPIEWRLKQAGFNTWNWGYNSLVGGVELHGKALLNALQDLEERDDCECVHLVTHSMGSILARFAVTRRKFSKLQRMVMLGPPHAGSRVARNLAYVFGPFLQPLYELSDDASSLVNSLPEPAELAIGVIAARRDRVVSIASTKLTTLTDHLTVDSGHNSMLLRADVADYVTRFLSSGKFSNTSPEPVAVGHEAE
jgi:pimeloyl-ACP methyl ester carboxylesterase